MTASVDPVTVTGTVLVVDDDPALQQTICDILATVGLEASAVGSAGEATRWCAGQRPDLVVVDQRLPDAPGLDLAAELKAGPSPLPVVLLTGHVSTDTAISAVGVVDDYLTKPVPPGELINVVRTRLEQYRLRAANQQLLSQLQEANGRLALTNARLEDTVMERTRELSTARDAAMEASRLKSQFLANMSHEIRTPMNAVLGVAQLLARTQLSQEQREYVDLLYSSGQTLLRVINDILDLSKVEAGAVHVEAAPFELLDPFAQTVDLLAAQAAEKGLALRLEGDPALPETVVGDAGLTRQVVTNLVSNAIKFTDAGHVHVSVRLAAGSPGLTVCCEVTDTGIGIDPADAPRLFREFTQVDLSSTRRHGGTGLGLAICDRLVRLMGGEIGCRPGPGGGTTFWFTLPLQAHEAAAAAPPAAPSALAAPVEPAEPAEPPAPAATGEEAPAAPLVLVVEDNSVNTRLLTRMLDALGYRSEAAESGPRAIDATRATEYAVILMDCAMPEMDGLATTRILRAGPAPVRTPIVAVTGTATTENREECLEAGMNDFVSKPITMDRLAAVLELWAPRRPGG